MTPDDDYTKYLRAGCLLVVLFPWLVRPYATARLGTRVEPGFFGGMGGVFFGLAAFGILMGIGVATWRRLKSKGLAASLGPLAAVVAAVCAGVAVLAVDRLAFSGTIQDLTVTGLTSGPLGSNEVGGEGGQLIFGCVTFQVLASLAAVRLLMAAVAWPRRASGA